MRGFWSLSWQVGVPTVTQASLGPIAVPSGVGLYVMATILGTCLLSFAITHLLYLRAVGEEIRALVSRVATYRFRAINGPNIAPRCSDVRMNCGLPEPEKLVGRISNRRCRHGGMSGAAQPHRRWPARGRSSRSTARLCVMVRRSMAASNAACVVQHRRSFRRNE